MPSLSMFLLRKSDMSRLCLTVDSSEGYVDNDVTASTVYSRFTAGGIGDDPMRLLFLVRSSSK